MHARVVFIPVPKCYMCAHAEWPSVPSSVKWRSSWFLLHKVVVMNKCCHKAKARTMGAFVIIITDNNTNMLEVQEEDRYLLGSGQGLQMPGGLSEHVLNVEMDSLPRTTLDPVAVLCSLHILPLWASYQLWVVSFTHFTEASSQTRKERLKQRAPKQGLKTERIAGQPSQ